MVFALGALDMVDLFGDPDFLDPALDMDLDHTVGVGFGKD